MFYVIVSGSLVVFYPMIVIGKRGEYLRKFIFAILIFIANKRYLMPASSEFLTNRKKLRQVVDIHGVKNDIHTDN